MIYNLRHRYHKHLILQIIDHIVEQYDLFWGTLIEFEKKMIKEMTSFLEEEKFENLDIAFKSATLDNGNGGSHINMNYIVDSILYLYTNAIKDRTTRYNNNICRIGSLYITSTDKEKLLNYKDQYNFSSNLLRILEENLPHMLDCDTQLINHMNTFIGEIVYFNLSYSVEFYESKIYYENDRIYIPIDIYFNSGTIDLIECIDNIQTHDHIKALTEDQLSRGLLAMYDVSEYFEEGLTQTEKLKKLIKIYKTDHLKYEEFKNNITDMFNFYEKEKKTE